MPPSTAPNPSKTLNALAPEYHPKILFTVPDPPPPFFLSPIHPSFLPPPPPQIFNPTPEFYLPTPPHAQPQTYYYISPENPSTVHPFPPPPEAAVPTGSSTLQVRKTISPPDEGFRRGYRRSCLGKAIEGRAESSRCVGNEENWHTVMSLKLNEYNTTLMLKNIPYDCPRDYLLDLLDRFCANCRNEPSAFIDASYDFFYLPIDFKTKKGRGFAFFNFTNAAAAWKFFDTFDSSDWDPLRWYRWPKKMEVARAKIQGKEALVSHFCNSTFECETDDFLPVYFSPPRDGAGHGVEMTSVGRRRIPIRRRRNHKA